MALRQTLIDKLLFKTQNNVRRPICALCNKRTTATDKTTAENHVERHYRRIFKCPVCEESLPFGTDQQNYHALKLHYQFVQPSHQICPYEALTNKRCSTSVPHLDVHKDRGDILWKEEQERKEDVVDILESESEDSEDDEVVNDGEGDFFVLHHGEDAGENNSSGGGGGGGGGDGGGGGGDGGGGGGQKIKLTIL